LSQSTRVTDRRTDGRTDRILITFTALHVMQRGKKQEILCMLSVLPIHLAVVPVSCSFYKKFVQSLQSPTFIKKFLGFLLHNV